MSTNHDYLSDKFFLEESKTLGWKLVVRKAIRNGLYRTYQHFVDWSRPECQTTEQYNTTVTNLFFHLVKGGCSALEADEFIREAIEDLRDMGARKDIVDRIAYSHQVMKPRWFEYFVSGKEIEYG